MKSRNSRLQRDTSPGRKFHAWSHTSAARSVLSIVVGTLLVCAIFYVVCAPKRYSLSVGTISHQTITATRDVVDEISTEEKRKAAANAIEPTYHLAEGVSDTVVQNLGIVFSELRTIQQYGLTLDDHDTEDYVDGFPTYHRSFTDSEIEYAQKLMNSFSLSRYQATTLLRTRSEDFETMVTTVTRAVENALNQGIREGKVTDAITTIQQVVGYRVDISLVQNVLPAVLKNTIQPNMVIDQETTAQARAKAMDSVEPIIYQQGQNIVREGEVVTSGQLAMVRALGMLEDEMLDLSGYYAAGILILLSIAILLLLLQFVSPGFIHDERRVCVMMLDLVLTMGFCALMIRIVNVYTAPIVMGSMILTVLYGWKNALPMTVCTSLMISGMAAGASPNTILEMLSLVLVNLAGSVIAIFLLQRGAQRIRLLVCGLVVGCVSALCVLIMGLMASISTTPAFMNLLWAFLGGLLGGVLTLGIQPILEGIFNLATPSKLMELGNPNHPLMKRLMLEAPGTYHHSMIVANLAEAAAEKIGANPLLARTGAYFHDIGKLKRPQYFKENQTGINPLDQTDPYVSAAIVTTHTRDGIQLAQKYRLPPEIQDIIIQHHGDTPVMFFYHRACQQADGKPVNINDFRYDGVRPATREAAIIMMADTTEAAVRSMQDPTPQAISSFIEQLVRGKIEDGQLSNSPLTLRDIDGICSAFCKVLNGVFHQRIEYPKADIPKRSFHTPAPAETAEKTGEKAAAAEKAAATVSDEPDQKTGDSDHEVPADSGQYSDHETVPDAESHEEAGGINSAN